MAVLGPPKPTLPPPLPPASKSPPNLLTSGSGLDTLERRLLAEVGTRTHLEAWDSTHHIVDEEQAQEENGGKTKKTWGEKNKSLKPFVVLPLCGRPLTSKA